MQVTRLLIAVVVLGIIAEGRAADAPVGVVPESVILACTPDAYRLCFTSLLDRTSAEACMRKNWALVSVRCKSAVAAAGIRK